MSKCAFADARHCGAHAVEIDVRKAKDDIVVFHDEFASDMAVSSLLAKEIKSICPWIMTLEEFLTWVQGKGKAKFKKIFVEVKEPEIVIGTLGVLTGYPALNFVVLSPIRSALVRAQQQIPAAENIEFGLLGGDLADPIGDAKEVAKYVFTYDLRDKILGDMVISSKKSEKTAGCKYWG